MFCFSFDEVYFLLSTTYEIVIEINDVITRLNAMLIDLCDSFEKSYILPINFVENKINKINKIREGTL